MLFYVLHFMHMGQYIIRVSTCSREPAGAAWFALGIKGCDPHQLLRNGASGGPFHTDQWASVKRTRDLQMPPN